MRRETRESLFRQGIFLLRGYIAIFLTIAFVVSCCVLIFVHAAHVTEAQVRAAALPTFVNLFILSLVCTVADFVRRIFWVEQPLHRLRQAMARMEQGDYTACPAPAHSPLFYDEFDRIALHLNHLAGELRGVETLRSDFISNVSHELKTPLAVIQNYAVLLQASGLPEAQRLEYARTIAGTTRRLSALITNILRLNKLENQQIFPASAPCDLSEQLCECLLAFEEAWERRGIELDTDIQPDVVVRTDAELLALVWSNLLSNAMKFTPDGGRVGVSLRVQDGCAVVSVTDTGCGISPEQGRHIFEKFYQGDASHATQGNGLGLALVKRVIDIVGGSISVESELGRGSRFTVTLKGALYDTHPTDPA